MDYLPSTQDQPQQSNLPMLDLAPFVNPDMEHNDHILYEYAQQLNLMDDLNEADKQKIVGDVLAGIDADIQTQREWLSKTDDALRLSKLTKEPKNTPLPNSANIKFPLIIQAAYQYAARTYPEIIQDGKIVKCELVGNNPDPVLVQDANAVSIHMSYQLLGPDNDWEASMDKLLVVLPVIGFVVKKTYFDPINKKNCSYLCHYKDIILRNGEDIQCMDDLRRVTHVLHVHPNDLIEGARAGIYDEEAVEQVLNFYSERRINAECTLFEQHNFRDLDDDKYEEPYIVVVHKETNTLLRVCARYTKKDIHLSDDGKKVNKITATQYFTDFHFLPAPDGCFMSFGFGTLMLHLNETVNTILNQLIDAGQLANLQTGFIDSRIKVMGGQTMVDPGSWMKVKGVIGQTLKDGVLPINYKEPSNVLFQLLGLLIKAGQDLTSSTDVLQGSTNAQNAPPTTVLALIEQGIKQLSALQRRLYRSLKAEYKKLFSLNARYLDPNELQNILGPEFSGINPYNNPSLRVIPIADPNLASDAQRLAQAQVIMSLSQQPDSLISKYEAQKRMLEAAKVANIGQLLPEKAQAAPDKPDPKLIQVQAKAADAAGKLQLANRHQDLKEKEFIAKLSKMDAEITQLQASSVKMVADADSTQHSSKMEEHAASLETLKTKLNTMLQAHQQLIQSNQQQASHALSAQQQAHNQQQDQIAAAQKQQELNQNQQQIDQQPAPEEQAPQGQDDANEQGANS